MSTVVRDVRDRVGELVPKLPHVYQHRIYAEQGFRTLSEFMEAEDASDAAERAQGYDAFTRAMQLKDIRTTSDKYGSWFAHPLGRFGEDAESRILGAEWMRRVWDGASSTRAAQRRREHAQQRAQALYLSGDILPGTVAVPFEDDTALQMGPDIEPAVPLAELVARTRAIDGVDYRKRSLVTPPVGEIRLLRVAEGTELPTAKIAEAQRAIRLFKFGRRLEATYEALRRLPLDDFALHIGLLRLQTEVDQVAAALDVAINGDGNAGTPAVVYNLTALDPATTANNLTLAAWISFKLKWVNPYGLTTVLAREAEMLKLLLLNVGTGNMLAVSAPAPLGPQQLVPMNQRMADGVRFGITADAPANRIVGFDGRFAIEHVTEAGSDISEFERFITRQVETVTFSLQENFAVFDTNSVKVLNLAA